MKEIVNGVRVHSFKAWCLAARPRTLAAAVAPVLIGGVMACVDKGLDGVRLWPFVFCFLFALIMQIDANFVNDYIDYRRGNDDVSTRLGPLRACTMGWIRPRAMQYGIGVTTLLAAAVGLPLIAYGGWWLVAVGAACILFCFLYTVCLSSMGLGDVLVVVFFGWVPVMLTYVLMLPGTTWSALWHVLWVSLACGLATDTLLVVNNYRDIDNDRRNGKRTLVVLLGHRGGELLYLFNGLAAVMLLVPLCAVGHIGGFLLPAVIYTVMHIGAYRRMRQIGEGRALNAVLALTSRNILLFALTCCVGYLVG